MLVLIRCWGVCAVSFNAFFPNDPATNAHVDVQDDHFQVVREIGAASVVLLKNVAGALPLRKPRSLAIIGKCYSAFSFFQPALELNWVTR